MLICKFCRIEVTKMTVSHNCTVFGDFASILSKVGNRYSCNGSRQQTLVTCCALSVQEFRDFWVEHAELCATGRSDTPQTCRSFAFRVGDDISSQKWKTCQKELCEDISDFFCHSVKFHVNLLTTELMWFFFVLFFSLVSLLVSVFRV